MPLRWTTLLTIAGGLGIGIGGVSTLAYRQKGELLSKTSVVKSAIRIVKDQKEVLELIGKPESIDIGTINLNDGWTKLGSSKAQIKVPFKGEVDDGYLFAYARKNQEDGKFRLFKLEMSLGKYKGKKLVLLDLDDVDIDIDLGKST